MCSNILISNIGYSRPNNLNSLTLDIIELEFSDDITDEDDEDILILEELGVLDKCFLEDFWELFPLVVLLLSTGLFLHSQHLQPSVHATPC